MGEEGEEGKGESSKGRRPREVTMCAMRMEGDAGSRKIVESRLHLRLHLALVRTCKCHARYGYLEVLAYLEECPPSQAWLGSRRAEGQANKREKRKRKTERSKPEQHLRKKPEQMGIHLNLSPLLLAQILLQYTNICSHGKF